METGWEGDLQIDQDLAYQKRAWVVQRVAWCIFCVLTLAGLIGLFGRGGVSHSTKSSADGNLRVEYERFVHYGTRESLVLRVRHSGGEHMDIWLNQAFLEAMEIRRVTPEPDWVRSEQDRLVYRFSVEPAKVLRVVKFGVEPEKAGTVRGEVGVRGGPELAIRQFVYP